MYQACYRYYHERKDKPMAAFLVADTSQNIMKADVMKMLKQVKKKFHSQNMLNILFNGRKAVPKEYKNIQKKYNNLGLEKFDVIILNLHSIIILRMKELLKVL